MSSNPLVRFLRPFLPLYELVYPPVCHACSVRVAVYGQILCDSCHASLPRVTHSSHFYQTAARRLCEEGNCHSLVTRFLFEDDGIIQDLIHKVKYGRDQVLAIELGRMIVPQLLTECRGSAIGGIVPLPLHRSRLRERGFNQADLIASGLAAGTGYRLIRPLYRTKATRSQTTLTAAERARNVRNAFAVSSRGARIVRGKRFILVDDVVTTGATLNEAAGVLRDAGALRPIVCTVAVAR